MNQTIQSPPNLSRLHPAHAHSKIPITPSHSQPAATLQPDAAETVKALITLAREHGRLTHDEVTNALPEDCPPEHRDAIYARLQDLGIDIGDPDEADDKPREDESEEERQLETLDDPLRQYLKQMGKVPLLTREQEINLFKRIEQAQFEITTLIYRLGFTAKEHIAIAEKLLSEPPEERFDRVVLDSQSASREKYLKNLQRLIKATRVLDANLDDLYFRWQRMAPSPARTRLAALLDKAAASCRLYSPNSFFAKKSSRI